MALSGFLVAARCLHMATRVGGLPSRIYTAEELKDQRYNHDHALEVRQRLALLLASPRPAAVVLLSKDTLCIVRSDHAVCKVFSVQRELHPCVSSLHPQQKYLSCRMSDAGFQFARVCKHPSSFLFYFWKRNLGYFTCMHSHLYAQIATQVVIGRPTRRFLLHELEYHSFMRTPWSSLFNTNRSNYKGLVVMSWQCVRAWRVEFQCRASVMLSS